MMSDSDPRVKTLEELVRRNQEELERVRHENDKLKSVLGRYRDRWEKLKEGAKTRRAEGRSNDGQSNPSTPGPSHQKGDIPASPLPDADSTNETTARNASGSEAEGNPDNAG